MDIGVEVGSIRKIRELERPRCKVGLSCDDEQRVAAGKEYLIFGCDSQVLRPIQTQITSDGLRLLCTFWTQSSGEGRRNKDPDAEDHRPVSYLPSRTTQCSGAVKSKMSKAQQTGYSIDLAQGTGRHMRLASMFSWSIQYLRSGFLFVLA